MGEFVALAALMTSLVALSIDAMLPALAHIGRDLNVARDNDRQLVISMLFIGLAVGQVVYGPISDSVGRKKPIYVGFVLFIVGSLLSAFATSFTMMILGRLLQGFGAAGPRIVVVAMVRDEFEGRAMARIMSMIMAVFILVPALAPAVGQGVLLLAHWRAIFAILFGLALVTLIWFAWRQPETLRPEKRAPLTIWRILRAARETCANRIAAGYTVAAGLIFGAFVGYLTSSQQIFQELYGVGHLFPLYFGGLALAIGAASLVNAKLVVRFGMQTLCRWALVSMGTVCLGLLAYDLATPQQVSLTLFMVGMTVSFFCSGILFGNFNALAMEPLGHIAGVAAAVIGSATTFISVALGGAIGAIFDGTSLPLVAGFALSAFVSLLVMMWVEKGRDRAPA